MMNAIHGVVVCGPSGVGKGTLLRRLLTEFADRFGLSVSHTSRSPRENEVDGKDYHFVSEEEILSLHKNNKLIELGHIHGKYYATSVAAFKKVQDEGKVCILEVDVNAIETIQKVPQLNATYIFVSAPREALRNRIVRRGSCTEKDVETRLRTAEYELDFFQKHPDYFQCVVENIDCEVAYKQLVDYLNKAFIAHGMKELMQS